MGKLFVWTHLSSLKFYWHVRFVQQSKTRVSPLSTETQGNFRLCFCSLQLPSMDINMVSHYWQSKGERKKKEIHYLGISTNRNQIRGLSYSKKQFMRIPLNWTFCNYWEIFNFFSIFNFNYEWAFLYHEFVPRRFVAFSKREIKDFF